MNLTETISLHQQLIDEAVAYKDLNNLTYKKMVDSLDKRHKAAIVFKDLNCQVENGGFLQWLDNGYGTAECVELLLGYLEEIKTDAANVAIFLLEDYRELDCPFVDDGNEDDYKAYNSLDTQYYKINAQLLLDIEVWLATIPTI